MKIEVFDLGLIDFSKAWFFQKELFKGVKNGDLAAGLIVSRHYPVITLGRSAKRENILASVAELSAEGIKVYAIERGGDVTYHGPGQITLYPVFNLEYFKKDLHWFLRKLEEAVIDFLASFGLSAKTYPGLTGVWLDEEKIASIGIAVKNWIAFYGVSINIKADDLENFQLVRPCGRDIKMACLEQALARIVEIESVKQNLLNHFQGVFDGQSSLAGIR